MHQGLISLKEEDQNWLFEDVIPTQPKYIRLFSLRALYQILSRDDCTSIKQTMIDAVSDDSELRAETTQLFAPRQMSDIEDDYLMKKKQKDADWDAFRKETTARINDIETANDVDFMIKVFHSLKPSSRSYSEIPVTTFAIINEDVATAFKSGSIAYWKKTSMEKSVGSTSTLVKDAFLLFGLGCAIRENPTLEEYAPPLIHKAIADGLKDLNFPEWLPVLCEAHPSIAIKSIQEHLAEVIENTHPGAAHAFQIVKDISRAQRLQPLLGDWLIEQVGKFIDVAGNNWAIEVVECLLSVETISPRLATIAKRIVCTGDSQYHDRWLDVWLATAPQPAWEYFKGQYATDPDNKRTMLLFAARHGQRTTHSFGRFLSYCVTHSLTNILKELLEDMYCCVQPEDDINHRGAYTPSSRDNAQSFRNEVLHALATIPGDDSFRSLIAFRDGLASKISKDNITRMIEEKRFRESEYPLFQSEFVQFTRDCAIVPKTADDLFNLAVRVLDHIKQDIENGDNSPHGLPVFRPDTHEFAVQKYFAAEIARRDRKRYVVSREIEVDGQKRVDIRFQCPGMGPVNVEVKCAHKWDFSSLEKALQDQLVGLYMKSENSKHGILLLVNAGLDWKWDRNSKDFNALIRSLEENAEKLRKGNPGTIRGLSVCSVDVTA